jgi:hypothetical protein
VGRSHQANRAEQAGQHTHKFEHNASKVTSAVADITNMAGSSELILNSWVAACCQ